jgi:hypothetical protein
LCCWWLMVSRGAGDNGGDRRPDQSPRLRTYTNLATSSLVRIVSGYAGFTGLFSSDRERAKFGLRAVLCNLRRPSGTERRKAKLFFALHARRDAAPRPFPSLPLY